jgi:hypothetical protein
MNGVPDYLYHYTTVESLAMILKNKSIKLNPLTVLDDSQEERVKDSQKFGKYIFVSSWTEDNNESIPMWNMYSNLTSGVRIQLPTYPFEEYLIEPNKLREIMPNANIEFKSAPNFSFVVPLDEIFSRQYFVATNIQNKILHKIKYTNDPEELEPKILYTENDKISVNMGALGKHKKLIWEFQKEWRYILNFHPMGYQEMYNQPNSIGTVTYMRYNNEYYNLPFNYYFLKINEESFPKMEITLSPKISDGYKVLVELLQEKYNSLMKINKSDLQDDIR